MLVKYISIFLMDKYHTTCSQIGMYLIAFVIIRRSKIKKKKKEKKTSKGLL